MADAARTDEWNRWQRLEKHFELQQRLVVCLFFEGLVEDYRLLHFIAFHRIAPDHTMPRGLLRECEREMNAVSPMVN